MKSSGSGLCRMHVFYWYIHTRMHITHCDNVATSFLDVATSGLWSVIRLNFVGVTVVMEFL